MEVIVADDKSFTDLSDILVALRKTPKGRLSYDRDWKEEGRTQEIISEVKQQLSAITVNINANRLATDNKSVTKLIDKQSNGNNLVENKQSPKYKITQRVKNESSDQRLLDKNAINGNRSDRSMSQANDSKANNFEKWRVSDLNLLNYDRERQQLVVSKMEKRKSQIKTMSKSFDEQNVDEKRLIAQKYSFDTIKKIDAYKEAYRDLADMTHESLDDSSANASFKMKEIERKHRVLVEEQEKKQQEIRHKKILALREEIVETVKSVSDLYNIVERDIKESQAFQASKQELHALITLVQHLDALLVSNQCSDSDIANIENFKIIAINLRDKIYTYLEQEKQQIRQLKQSESISVDSVGNQDMNINVNVVLPSSDNVSKLGVQTNANHENQLLKDYLNLQQFLATFEKSFEGFVSDPKCKIIKHDLQLFVKTTINSISCESVEHIRDKLNRLTLLFSGRAVELSGKQISCNKREDALNFCISLSCKMFISVGTKQKDIALTMAPIIVQLWSRFPIFGKVFFAQMREKCPYIVPYYPARDPNDSETAYLILCGYSITSDKNIESEEAFLNRMKAIVKIYAAIIQSNIQANHPHDINYGWDWLARVLNAEPRPAITAAVLESFLSITAHKLYLIYGRQFVKLINFIFLDYMNRIKNISQKDIKRQSLVKLEMYITELRQKLAHNASPHELKPEGLIPEYFWQNSYNFSRGINYSNT